MNRFIHRPRRRRGRSLALLLTTITLVAWIVAPAAALAHAELESSIPEDGAVLTTPPTEVVLTYSEGLDEGSSIVLKDAAGTEIARGTPAAVGATEMRASFDPLAPGVYTIESTSRSTADGDIDHKRVTFTVAEPTPAPATATPTAEPPSTAASPTAAPSGPPAPSASPTPAGGASPGAGDALIPVAVVAIFVVGALAFLLRRRAT